MAAVLACGDRAALSHGSAAALWGFRPLRTGPIDIACPVDVSRSRPGIVSHRRRAEAEVVRHGIPVTSPVTTLLDLATQLPLLLLQSAIAEADRLDLVSPPALWEALPRLKRRRGTGPLRRALEPHTSS